MSTDPSQIRLTPAQQRQIAELADRVGKPWPAVLDEAMAEYHARPTANGGHDKSQAIFGGGRGLVSLSDDFDEPLEDFRAYAE